MKIKSNVKLKRKHEYDAGIDIPFFTDIVLQPNETVAINTMVTVEIPRGMFGMLISRSSAAKKGLIVAMSPIDSGYTGDIHVIVSNVSANTYHFLPGESIAQLVVMPCTLVELTNGDIADERGNHAFGSTNL